MVHFYYVKQDANEFRLFKNSEVIATAANVEMINMIVAGIHFTHNARDERFEVLTMIDNVDKMIAGDWIEIPRNIKG